MTKDIRNPGCEADRIEQRLREGIGETIEVLVEEELQDSRAVRLIDAA